MQQEDLRPTVGTLRGTLRDSAVARLLVDGKLPDEEEEDDRVPPSMMTYASPPMDLSARSKINEFEPVHKVAAPQHLEQLHKTITMEMRRLMLLPYRGGMEWKCTFCPYIAKDRPKLYSHYQFHLQLLTSSSPASESHLEWLAAYRTSRGFHHAGTPPSDGRHSASPPDDWSAEDLNELDANNPRLKAWPHLRHLLATRTSSMSPTENQPSASGFLRSIVQTIMQKSPTSTPPPTLIEPESPSPPNPRTPSYSPTPLNNRHAIGSVIKQELSDSEQVDDTSVDKNNQGSSEHLALPFQSQNVTYHNAELMAGCRRKRKPGATLDEVVRCLTTSSSSGSPTQQTHGGDPDSDSSNNDMKNADASGGSPIKRARTESSDSSTTQASFVSSGGFVQDGHVASPHHNATHHNALTNTTNDIALDCNSRAIQCELIYAPLPPVSVHTSGSTSDTESLSDGIPNSSDNANLCRISEAQEGQCNVMTVCQHCGISFDDEVLHSIHMGCHSHKDPFICNVCGKYCHNKYGFYSHIMRGHSSS